MENDLPLKPLLEEQLPPPTKPQEKTIINHKRVVLVIGACGMDRLLRIERFPKPDSKIRTLPPLTLNYVQPESESESESDFSSDVNMNADSTNHYEIVGGNAANVAVVLAQLARAQVFHPPNHHHHHKNHPAPLQVKLLTKIGNDAMGTRIRAHVEQRGVELVMSPNNVQEDDSPSPSSRATLTSTTGVTTILVGVEDQTRTCIHTPGSCGELSVQDDLLGGDSDHMDITGRADALLENVVHVHSDARHADVAVVIMKQALKRGISVSIDVEKDRQAPALDALLLNHHHYQMHASSRSFTSHSPLLLFTNAGQMHDYMTRLNHEHERVMHKKPLLNPPTVVVGYAASEDDTKVKNKNHLSLAAAAAASTAAHLHPPPPDLLSVCCHALQPSALLTRWSGSSSEAAPATATASTSSHSFPEVVITKGSMGSLHVQCQRKRIQDNIHNHNTFSIPDYIHEMKITSITNDFDIDNTAAYPPSTTTSSTTTRVEITHTFTEEYDYGVGNESSSYNSIPNHRKEETLSSSLSSADYVIHAVGVVPLPVTSIVDTTGAGDAFIAGFLMARIFAVDTDTDTNDNDCGWPVHMCMQFGTWVSACKLQGLGAQSATLPTSQHCDAVLGTTYASARIALNRFIN